MTYTAASGPVMLGAVIASAAEGLVADVAGRPTQVAKILHGLGSHSRVETVNADPGARMRKIAVMIANPPRAQFGGHVVLAWPQELVFEDGQAVGYLMPRIDVATTVPLRVLLASPRTAPRGGADWVGAFGDASRTRTGMNLCRAVAAVHSRDAVIGDFNDSNVLVSASAQVSIVDCDSMQFRDPSGLVHLCDVGHVEYLPPELLGRTRDAIVREPESDYYSLAVHLFRLLLGGTHPFSGGVWTGDGERKSTRTLVKLGQYVGAAGSPLVPGAGDGDPSSLTVELRTLFDRAFRFGARRPADRPAPHEWFAALENTERVAR